MSIEHFKHKNDPLMFPHKVEHEPSHEAVRDREMFRALSVKLIRNTSKILEEEYRQVISIQTHILTC